VRRRWSGRLGALAVQRLISTRADGERHFGARFLPLSGKV
jgi:hypothetical protein